jgi:hypothetical protein
MARRISNPTFFYLQAISYARAGKAAATCEMLLGAIRPLD